MTAVLPEYGARSLAEVLPALLGALGVPGPARRASRSPPVRAAALLLVDGLGTELLRRHAADAPFLAGLTDAGPLTAGFPSSTSDQPQLAGHRPAAGRPRDGRHLVPGR